MRLPYFDPGLDREISEHWIIPDETTIEEGSMKNAYLLKWKDIYGCERWIVKDVDAGFKTSDRILQELIDDYIRRKNEEQFEELCDENYKEKIIH